MRVLDETSILEQVGCHRTRPIQKALLIPIPVIQITGHGGWPHIRTIDCFSLLEALDGPITGTPSRVRPFRIDDRFGSITLQIATNGRATYEVVGRT